MTQYRNQTTGHVVTLPGSTYGIEVAGQVVGANTSAKAMAELGYLPYTPEPEVVIPPTLAEAKAARIEVNRAECHARIVAVWSEDRQRSAAMGVYTPAECQACADWIAANVAAENAAANLLTDAGTPEALAAVGEPLWP